MRINVVLLAALFSSLTMWGQPTINCNSNAPYAGYTASVAPPTFSPGDVMPIYFSGFEGSSTEATFSDSGTVQQVYSQASPYSYAGSGGGVTFQIPYVTADLSGQLITGSWPATDGNVAPAIGVCDIGPGWQEVWNQYEPSIRAGFTDYELSSKVFQVVLSPNLAMWCVGAGLTELNPADWVTNVGDGWVIPSGMITPQFGCAFKYSTIAQLGTAWLEWGPMDVNHSYGTLVVWIQSE